jgi:hypothetical protein
VLGRLERTVQPRRGHLEPGVVDVLDLQHVLQLAGHRLAVLDRHELLPACGVGLAGHTVDIDAQQPAGRSLDIDEFITQTCHRLLDGWLQLIRVRIPFQLLSGD